MASLVEIRLHTSCLLKAIYEQCSAVQWLLSGSLCMDALVHTIMAGVSCCFEVV